MTAIARYIAPRLNGPCFAQNPLPESLVTLILNARHGIFVVAGPADSGKTTLIAALVAEINAEQQKRISMIEEAVELIQEPGMITRQTFDADRGGTSALYRAAREKPDFIVIDGPSDTETIQSAVSTALTGHVVILALHAHSVVGAISRIGATVDQSRRDAFLNSLSHALRAVIVQTIVPAADGGLVAAREILVNNAEVGAQIQDANPFGVDEQLLIANGMRSLDAELVELWSCEKITDATVRLNAVNPDALPERFAAEPAE